MLYNMNISRKEALSWFEFFANLPEDQELMADQLELVYAVFAKIEEAVDKRNTELMAKIPHLKTLNQRTYYVGPTEKFPQGCRSCLLGTGLTAIRKTNKCNMHCKFCYDYGELDNIEPIGEGMWSIGGTKYYDKDIDLLLSIYKNPTGVAYVYLEPFMEIEKYYGIISKLHKAGIYQHMYTNGTLATAENLKALGEAGLDELRFNLGASDCSDKVIANIALAKKYIKKVGVETPMTPEFYQEFVPKKEAVLATGLDFMNCAELHLGPNNIENYAGEDMYIARQGYISPIWSREITFKMMTMAATENWPLVVHDCSNYTKFARDINQGAKEGRWFGASSYEGEFTEIPYAVFLPILRDENFKLD